MIQSIEYTNIDRGKWDNCILSNGNGRMYALSAYLDVVCKRWDALVLGNYDVVMPLPLKRKWTTQWRYDMPLYVQQLGIIGLDNSENELKKQFINTAANLYPNFIHAFNHENGLIELDGFESITRTNFELKLGRSYVEIRNGYSDNLKRNLKKSDEANLEFKKNSEFKLLEKFINQFSKPDDPSPRHLEKIRRIVELSHPNYHSNVYSVWNEGVPLAVCYAPKFQKRITLLIPRSSGDGRTVNAMAYLIDQIIHAHAGSDMILDFEGSMIPGVAQFYKGFGALNRIYTLVEV